MPVRLIVHTTEAAMRGGPCAERVSAEASAHCDGTSDLASVGASDASRGGDFVDQADADAPVSAETPPAAVLDAGPGIPLLPLGSDTLRRLACQALVESAVDPDIDPDGFGETNEADDPCDGRSRRAQHRFATARQRRALLRRDGGCAFPGCARRRGLHAHHRVHWSAGGPTTMKNLLLACEHHHLLLHEGGWQLRPQQDASGQCRWTAFHDDGRVIPPAPATGGDADDLRDTHDADIASGTVTGTWLGEPLDLAYAVSVFSQ